MTEQFFNSLCGESCDELRIKIIKCLAVCSTLSEYAFPTEPGLGTLKYEKFKEPPVVVYRASPFVIMVIGQ